jgi:hypothetical protein
MSFRYSDSIVLKTIQCYSCAITFAVPEEWDTNRRNDHESFTCPNGHAQSYLAQSDAEKYKAALEREQREAATLRERAVVAERAQRRAEQAINRHKKRAAAGVCPCCNRTVSQLAAHMKSKHAEFMELQGLTPHKQLPEKVQ